MPDLRLTPERWEQLRRLAEAVEYCVDHGTAPALTHEAILATCAFREIERLERQRDEALALVVALCRATGITADAVRAELNRRAALADRGGDGA